MALSTGDKLVWQKKSRVGDESRWLGYVGVGYFLACIGDQSTLLHRRGISERRVNCPSFWVGLMHHLGLAAAMMTESDLFTSSIK
jgi:hypothetical protein